ncbi:MAG: AbrB/MazE/SpoVT family DNA-binding domain-containing protein [Clostridiales Family XIII bacterium]|jgi:AbrB family looped-hinge helix DNA binding protein|nr:AbrB/MazE/SpoVT family DNA-binding domain-containing protein [Clostridiales Family XIII bacterium]
MLDVARISVKGQVTIPVEIRKRLGLKEGDKVVFMEKGDNIIILNSNRLAFENFQREMAGEAEKAGLESEQDVVDLVKQVRGKMWEDQNEGNA